MRCRIIIIAIGNNTVSFFMFGAQLLYMPDYGEKLAARRVRGATTHSGIIAMPFECVGTKYDRYINRKTGIITLVPRKETEIKEE